LVDLDQVTTPGQDGYFFTPPPASAQPAQAAQAPVFPTRAGYAPVQQPITPSLPRANGPSTAALAGVAVGVVGVIAIIVGFVTLAHKDKHTEGNAVLRPIQQAQNVQLESALRLGATAEETYLAEHGTYTTDLAGAGYRNSAVQITVISATASDYCMQATSAGATAPEYDSKSGGFSSTPCH
jgi:hypothetical protein